MIAVDLAVAGRRHRDRSGTLANELIGYRVMLMEMHQVRYFLALAEVLNFTRASDRCNVTQPALSRAIKLLEEELGGLLFRREHESTHLTDLGHMVRPHLQSVYHHSMLAKHLSQDFERRLPLKLGIMH